MAQTVQIEEHRDRLSLGSRAARVSRPVIAEHEGEIVIVGGMDCYHLDTITTPSGRPS